MNSVFSAPHLGEVRVGMLEVRWKVDMRSVLLVVVMVVVVSWEKRFIGLAHHLFQCFRGDGLLS